MHPPDSPIAKEWDLFRRELPRLLAEGHEGRWALVKNEELIGIWHTYDEARTIGLERFGVVPMLVQEIRAWYRPVRAGNWWRCPL
jgi:hypothetical protein